MIRRALLVAITIVAASPACVAADQCLAESRRAGATLSRIFREWPLHPSGDPLDAAVRQLAGDLAARSGESQSRHWRTHVVRDSNLNAFSIGDGHIFITEGMLGFVRNEGELAALLAHEFGHHLAGHFCSRNKRRGLFGSKEDDAQARRQVGSLTALVDPEREREADLHAVRILDNAGYDPRVAIELALRMARNGGSGAHFQYAHRIEALNELLATRPARTTPSPPDSLAFENLKQALRN
jgi:beta-barrel assembly-enhancing protease